MVQCPVCYSIFHTISYLLTHIRLLHADQPNFQIQCNLQGCKRTFRKFSVYRNHIYQFHDTKDVSEEQRDDSPESNAIDDTIYRDDTSHGNVSEEDDEGQSEEVTHDLPMPLYSQEKCMVAAGKCVLKISENHKIPDIAMDNIISDVQCFFEIGMGKWGFQRLVYL